MSVPADSEVVPLEFQPYAVFVPDEFAAAILTRATAPSMCGPLEIRPYAAYDGRPVARLHAQLYHACCEARERIATAWRVLRHGLYDDVLNGDDR